RCCPSDSSATKSISCPDRHGRGEIRPEPPVACERSVPARGRPGCTATIPDPDGRESPEYLRLAGGNGKCPDSLPQSGHDLCQPRIATARQSPSFPER